MSENIVTNDDVYNKLKDAFFEAACYGYRRGSDLDDSMTQDDLVNAFDRYMETGEA